MKINVTFRETGQSFNANFDQFQESNQSFDTTFEHFQEVTIRQDVEYYEGSFEVTPKVDAQTLATADKFMAEDVHIKEIPFFDVTNLSGGSTVYIGSEVE